MQRVQRTCMRRGVFDQISETETKKMIGLILPLYASTLLHICPCICDDHHDRHVLLNLGPAPSPPSFLVRRLSRKTAPPPSEYILDVALLCFPTWHVRHIL